MKKLNEKQKCENKKLYLVMSYTGTMPGKMIVFRATLKFWNRYAGDTYSHISLSKDKSLTEMYSFARKNIHNPFDSGFVKESIYEGMFKLKSSISKITVFEVPVTKEKYDLIWQTVEEYWEKRNILKFNYRGLIMQLLFARGIAHKDHFYCSQWVATVLSECNVRLLEKNPTHARPFDFYEALKDKIIFEGYLNEYNLQNRNEGEKGNART